ncbi:MAG: efflux RND transporter periplasmic adaptor subunit [Archangiaceae bacterium]|nr:efflux RND transporter periplasmic adaptor subunit [Archangiaceae bacterium]
MKRLGWVVLCWVTGCAEGVPAPDAGVALATWVKVRAGAPALTLEAPARVIGGPGTLTWLTVPMRATVRQVHVQVGDRVDAGAPLIEVVMPELLEAAGRAEGARARLQAWSDRLGQLTQLRTEGLAKALDVSEASAKVAEAKADLQGARAVLLSAGLGEREAAGVLAGSGAFALRAPVAGVVTAVTVSAGENRPSGTEPLAQLAGPGPVRVEARFTVPAPEGAAELVAGGESTPLTAIARAPAADPRDGTFLAWFEPVRPVAAGVLGRVVLHPREGPGLMRVPAEAITRLDGGAQVETRRGTVAVEVMGCEAVDCVTRGALTVDDEVRAP